MRDDFCGREPAEASAGGEIKIFGQAGKEAGCKEVSRSRRIDDLRDREGRDGARFLARDDERTVGRTGDDAKDVFRASAASALSGSDVP